MRHKECAICCIVPPHILNRLSESTEYRENALRSLAISERLRGRREAFSLISALGLPAGTKRRTIYNAHNLVQLPGELVRGEDDGPTADAAVNEAYDFSGTTYDFYQKAFNRNSIDDNGMRLDSSVHYEQDLDNAFWDGRQMVYGDGDRRIFDRFTKSIDVVGHELTHGVTANTAGLTYNGQPGALNESISDVFGSLVKQYSLNQSADEADWLIGAELFLPGINGQALRSMKEPGTAYDDPVIGKDPQPAHMDDYQDVNYDHGGVHINSGIPNRAFCLTALELGGFAWQKAGKIWYLALTQRLSPDSDFQAAANATHAAAGELFGQNSLEQNAVKHGWEQVGVRVEAAMATAASAGRKSPRPVGAVPSSKKRKPV